MNTTVAPSNNGWPNIRQVEKNGQALKLSELARRLAEIRNQNLSIDKQAYQVADLASQITNSLTTLLFSQTASGALTEKFRIPAAWQAEPANLPQARISTVASAAIEQMAVVVDDTGSPARTCVVAAPIERTDGTRVVLVQLLALGAQSADVYALILQLVVGFLDRPSEKSVSEVSLSLLASLSAAVNRKTALQSVCDGCCQLGASGVIAAIETSKEFALYACDRDSALPKDAARTNTWIKAVTESTKYQQVSLLGRSDSNQKHAPLLFGIFELVQDDYVAFVPLGKELSRPDTVLVIQAEEREALTNIVHAISALNPSLTDMLASKADGPRGKAFEILQRLSNFKVKRAAALLAVVALLAMALMIPIQYEVDTPVVIEPLTKRFVTVPFNGVLQEVQVKPGDLVREGELLAVLDDKQLQWELAELIAERQQTTKEKDGRLARGSAADVQILQLKIAELNSQIDLVEHRLQNLQIIAPLTGLVIAGDVQRNEGAAVAIGDALFELAPLDQVTAELAIDEEEIAQITNGLSAEIRMAAFPSQTLLATVEMIRPRAEIRDARNVFVAETTLGNEESLLRPGMRGDARIVIGKRSAGWVWFHRPWRKLEEMLFW
ncbi:MAG: efflux RND transporter periplasmic adaptor subunit [Pseudomonadota bacterium]